MQNNISYMYFLKYMLKNIIGYSVYIILGATNSFMLWQNIAHNEMLDGFKDFSTCMCKFSEASI